MRLVSSISSRTGWSCRFTRIDRLTRMRLRTLLGSGSCIAPALRFRSARFAEKYLSPSLHLWDSSALRSWETTHHQDLQSTTASLPCMSRPREASWVYLSRSWSTGRTRSTSAKTARSWHSSQTPISSLRISWGTFLWSLWSFSRSFSRQSPLQAHCFRFPEPFGLPKGCTWRRGALTSLLLGEPGTNGCLWRLASWRLSLRRRQANRQSAISSLLLTLWRRLLLSPLSLWYRCIASTSCWIGRR